MSEAVRIQLTQGKVTFVDAADAPALLVYRWFAMKNRRHWCAGRNAPKQNGKRGTIYMHRQLMGFPVLEVDHKDHNGLNNRRSNLRLATDLQQAANRWNPRNRVGYRGVIKRLRKWVPHCFEARINVNRKYRKLGYFKSAKLAALAYDKAAREIFGEFAVLNFAKSAAS